MKTLYLKYNTGPLPQSGEQDAILLIGDALYGPYPLQAYGLKQDADIRGLMPDNITLIDMQQWVGLLQKFERWITC